MFDEVRNGLYYFEQSLWDVVPRLYRATEEALAESYPGEAFAVPPFLRFGSWIGGDRDGNPHVTARVTEQTLLLHKDVALGLFERDLDELQRHLSVSSDRSSAALAASLEAGRGGDARRRRARRTASSRPSPTAASSPSCARGCARRGACTAMRMAQVRTGVRRRKRTPWSTPIACGAAPSRPRSRPTTASPTATRRRCARTSR